MIFQIIPLLKTKLRVIFLNYIKALDCDGDSIGNWRVADPKELGTFNLTVQQTAEILDLEIKL